MNKAIIYILMAFLLIGATSAADWDNTKSFDSSASRYGKITITNALGLGSKLAEYTLIDNTDECLINCYTVRNVTIYNNEKLFSELKFYDKKGKDKSLNYNQLFLGTVYEEIIETPYYEDVCNGNKCNITFIENRKETVSRIEWTPYNYETLKAGDYIWKIEGKKEYWEAVDWIPTTFGKELNEWAWWLEYDGTPWVLNQSITTGLYGGYLRNSMTVFNITNQMWAISGKSEGTYAGWVMDANGVWVTNASTNTTVLNGISSQDDGTFSKPEVFYFYKGWHMITGIDEHYLVGWSWSGSAWVSNATMIGGATSESQRLHPTVLNMNNGYQLIVGSYVGTWDGFTWSPTSSQWVANATLINGLQDVGQNAAPTSFKIGSKYFLIAGNLTGGTNAFSGWDWNGTGWHKNLTIVQGLPVEGDGINGYATPEVFVMKGAWYGLFGTLYGGWNGTTLNILEPNNPPTIPLKDINSTAPLKNTTNYDVKGWFNCSDADVGATLTYNLYWLKNNVTTLTYTGLSVTTDVVNEITLKKDNLTEGDLWSYQINCSDSIEETWVNSTQIKIEENTPTLNSVWINSSSPTTNYTIDDIYSYFTCDDDMETALTYDISWLKNNITTITYTGLSYTSGTLQLSTLHNGNTTVEDLWNAEVRCSNSLHSSAYKNSTQILIENRPPTQPTVQLPTANYVVSNETALLKCNGSTDADGHSINYEIYTSTVNPPTTLKQNTTAETYDNTFTLQDKTTYYIRCRANDGIDNSTYTSVRTYYVNNKFSYNGTMGYEATTVEGKLEYFNITFTFNKLRVSDVDAKLIYDGVLSSAATKTKVVDNSEIGEYRFVVGMYMPSVTTDTAKTGVWNLTMTLNNGSSMLNNTFTFSQTVLNSNIFLCGNATTNATQLFAYNFTFWDEVNNTRFTKNATFKGNFQIYVNNQSLNTTILVDNSTVNLLALGEIDICLTPVNATFGVDADIEYYAEDYDKRSYYMRGSVMKQSLAPDAVKLYLLHEDLDDGVTVYVQDSGAVGIPNALVYIQRYYPELDQYLLVAMAKTNNWGVDYTYLRKYDVFYRFVVIQNGAITFTSTPTKVTGDIVTLTVEQTTVEEQTQAFEDVSYTLVWNNASKRAVVTWTSPTEKTLCLKCIKVTPTGNSQVKDECLTASAGVPASLYCFLNESFEYQAIFYGSGDINRIIDLLTIMNKGWDDIASKIGLEGVGYTLIVSGTLAAIGVAMGSLVFAIAGAIIGLIMMTALGLVKITYAMLIGITVVAIIAIIRVIKR